MESGGVRYKSPSSLTCWLIEMFVCDELRMNEKGAARWQPLWYSRRESNPNRRNRNPIFYPLNYGNRICYAKVGIISDACK